MGVEKIVTGGQTGADRAALEVAVELGLHVGGWVPRGRRAEDGSVPERFTGLRETSSSSYAERTELNIRDSDATLVLSFGTPVGGSALTAERASARGKPLLTLNLEQFAEADAVEALRAWLCRETPRVLNVAGPRLSQEPRIAQATTRILRQALQGNE